MALIESFEDIPSRGPPRPLGSEPEPTLVWLTGEHDTSTVTELSATLARAIALDDADLLLDLSGVGFMDVSTLRVILRARGFLTRRGRTLVLRSPARCALLVLDSCGMAGLVATEAAQAQPTTRTAGALASWVEVPATDVPPRTSAARAAAPASRCREGV